MRAAKLVCRFGFSGLVPAGMQNVIVDPWMLQLEEGLQGMLDRLARESPRYRPADRDGS